MYLCLVSCFTSPVCLTSSVSCLLSHVSCSPVSRLMSHISCHLSVVSCQLSLVACLMSPVSCLLSHDSCLTSLVLSPVSFRLSPVSFLTSPVSHLLSHVSCLTYPVSCLLSHVPSTVPNILFLRHCHCSIFAYLCATATRAIFLVRTSGTVVLKLVQVPSSTAGLWLLVQCRYICTKETRHIPFLSDHITGSIFLQRFRIFLGQCAHCVVWLRDVIHSKPEERVRNLV